MRKLVPVVLMLTTAFILGCEDSPTEVTQDTSALFKKGGSKPGGGGDPPPTPIGDPVILFSSSLDAKVGGGGCTKGNLSWSIYRMDINGSFERVLDDAVEIYRSSTQPNFSPDGQRFVFGGGGFTLAKGKCTDHYRQIATANVDGTGFQVLRQTELSGQLKQPRWSPGPVGGVERIGWLERIDGVMSVVVAGTDGSMSSAVVTGATADQVAGFEWSRSGDAILVLLDEGTPTSALRLYALDCAGSCIASSFSDVGDLSPIPPDRLAAEIVWARQHDWVAVPVGGNGLWKIDLTAPTAPVATQLTAAGLQGEVTWGPDDTQLLFTAWPGTAIELDLTVATLPWTGDLGAPGVRVLGDIGNTWGLDWRRF